MCRVSWNSASDLHITALIGAESECYIPLRRFERCVGGKRRARTPSKASHRVVIQTTLHTATTQAVGSGTHAWCVPCCLCARVVPCRCCQRREPGHVVQ